MDSSLSQDPLAPDTSHAQAQEKSAEELAPPNRDAGQGPGDPNPEVFPVADVAGAPDVEKVSDRHWTHDDTDEIFPTKREAVADAADPTPAAGPAGPTDTEDSSDVPRA